MPNGLRASVDLGLLNANRRAVWWALALAWLAAWVGVMLGGGAAAWLWVATYTLLLTLSRVGPRAEQHLRFGCAVAAGAQALCALVFLATADRTGHAVGPSVVSTTGALIALGLIIARRPRIAPSSLPARLTRPAVAPAEPERPAPASHTSASTPPGR